MSSKSRERYRAGKRLWSRANDAELRRRYPNESTAALARDLRRTTAAVYGRAGKLGLSKSAAYLASPAAFRFRRGYHKGWDYRFGKGHVPANKGLRRPGWSPGRMKETQFKPGVRQGVAVKLYKPIGSERVTIDGYLERKINDAMPLQKRWRAVHVLLWEAVHGPVPPGHAIVFRNGDKADIRIDNLERLSRADLMKRNSVHHLPKELAAAVQLLGALHRQIRKRSVHAQQD